MYGKRRRQICGGCRKNKEGNRQKAEYRRGKFAHTRFNLPVALCLQYVRTTYIFIGKVRYLHSKG